MYVMLCPLKRQYFDNDEDMLQEFFWERNWRDLNLAAEVAGDAGYKAINQATPEIRQKMGKSKKFSISTLRSGKKVAVVY